MQKPEHCRSCPAYGDGTGFVSGQGDPCKPWILAERPGNDEVRRGVPLVGASGWECEKACQVAGLPRAGWYATNVFKCKLPRAWEGQREAEIHADKWAAAARHCSRYLAEEVEHSGSGPPCVLLMGGRALWRLVGLDLERSQRNRPPSIQFWRGSLLRQSEWLACLGGRDRVVLFPGIEAAGLRWPGDPWILPTWHPSYLLHGQWGQRPIFARDIHRLLGARTEEPRRVLPRIRSVVTHAPPPSWAERASQIVLDVETAEEDPTAIFLLGVMVVRGEAWMIPWLDSFAEELRRAGGATASRLWPIAQALADPRLPKVGHNLRYDILLSLRANNLNVPGPYWDTAIAANMEEPDMLTRLCEVASRTLPDYVQWKGLPASPGLQAIWRTILGSSVGQFVDWWQFYNAMDLLQTWRVKDALRARLAEDGRLRELEENELPVLPKLWAMETRGWHFNRARAKQQREELLDGMAQAVAELLEIVEPEWDRAFAAAHAKQAELEALPACPKHPKYNGLRKPGARKCRHCLELYEERKGLIPAYSAAKKEIRRHRIGFRPFSTTDWIWWLYDVRGHLPRQRTRKTRQPSLDDDALRVIYARTNDETVRIRMLLSQAQHDLATFIDPFLDPQSGLLDQDDVARPVYHLNRTGSGRLAGGGGEQEET